MSELEQALVALGHELELPPTPDVAAAVRARIARRARRRRGALALALALLLAAAVALAVPAARSAILRFFHIRGAQVSLVERLPKMTIRRSIPGEPATLARAPFRVLLPDGEKPDAVRLADGSVWLRYGPSNHPRLVVVEITTGGPWFIKKVAADGSTVRHTSVAGQPAIWISGAPHALVLPIGGARLAGNTMLWQHGPLTLRLEADVDLTHARAIAASFR